MSTGSVLSAYPIGNSSDIWQKALNGQKMCEYTEVGAGCLPWVKPRHRCPGGLQIRSFECIPYEEYHGNGLQDFGHEQSVPEPHTASRCSNYNIVAFLLAATPARESADRRRSINSLYAEFISSADFSFMMYSLA